jgi:hypothetical protein
MIRHRHELVWDLAAKGIWSRYADQACASEQLGSGRCFYRERPAPKQRRELAKRRR